MLQLLFSFAFICGLLVILVGRQAPVGPPDSLTIEKIAIAFLALGAAIGGYVVAARLPMRADPPFFQTRLLVSAALAEFCTLLGVFVFRPNGPAQSEWFFFSLTMGVIVLLVVKTISYWNERSQE